MEADFVQAADDILAELGVDATVATDKEGPHDCRILRESDKSEARDESDSTLAMVHGAVAEDVMSISFKKDVLTTVPVINQNFYLNDDRYRITAVEDDQIFLDLELTREGS